MKRTVSRLAGLAALIVTTSFFTQVAFAADGATPQNFIDQGFPVEKAGSIDGIPVYQMHGDTALWFRMPDGMMIAGWAFDKGGEDLNAKILNIPAQDAWKTIGQEAPIATPESAQSNALSKSDLVDVVNAALTKTDAAKPSKSQADQSKAALDATMAATASTIKDMPEAKKRELLLDLMTQIKAASNPADFQLRLVEWNEKVAGKKLISDEARAKLEATAKEMGAIQKKAENLQAPQEATVPTKIEVTPLPALKPSPSSATEMDGSSFGGAKLINAMDVAPTIETAPVAASSTAVPESVKELANNPLSDPRDQLKAIQVAQANQAAGPSKEAAQANAKKLVADIQQKGYILSYGRQDAPVVYMFSDPLCPHCALAFSRLEKPISEGKIQLKVLPVPVISKNSPGALATIMQSKDPAKALWDSEMGYAKAGRPTITISDFTKLPQAENDALHENYNLVDSYNLPGVPFFAWTVNGEVKVAAGEPKQALIESFEGGAK